ncbi:MAG: sulfurtransferase TusA family protein [Alphaproteobacteria bacterium]|jgi:tRNA 2-thiouridine synthesizing protein A|nr:sulfurtransferase TusA family protein [Alphaproteobacteria bacterium]
MVAVDRILDTSGLNCPLPLLKLKKAIRTIPPGGLIEIIASDPGAPEDFAAFCTAEGHDLVDATAADGRYTALIRRAA